MNKQSNISNTCTGHSTAAEIYIGIYVDNTTVVIYRPIGLYGDKTAVIICIYLYAD